MSNQPTDIMMKHEGSNNYMNVAEIMVVVAEKLLSLQTLATYAIIKSPVDNDDD